MAPRRAGGRVTYQNGREFEAWEPQEYGKAAKNECHFCGTTARERLTYKYRGCHACNRDLSAPQVRGLTPEEISEHKKKISQAFAEALAKCSWTKGKK